MDLEGGLATLVFVCIFELVGGAALGVALRGAFGRTASPTSWFFLAWGGGFAGIPLVIGAALFLGTGQPGLFAAQVFVFLATVFTAALVPDELFQAARTGEQARFLISVIAGGMMTLFGATIILLTFRIGLGLALIAGVVLAAAGLLLVGRGVLGVIRNG